MSRPPLSPPAIRFQGEWGPLWAVYSPPLKCPACHGLSSVCCGDGMLRGPRARQAVVSSQAALPFRGVLSRGACAVIALGAALGFCHVLVSILVDTFPGLSSLL